MQVNKYYVRGRYKKRHRAITAAPELKGCCLGLEFKYEQWLSITVVVGDAVVEGKLVPDTRDTVKAGLKLICKVK